MKKMKMKNYIKVTKMHYWGILAAVQYTYVKGGCNNLCIIPGKDK